MSVIKLVVDMNLSPSWVEYLRNQSAKQIEVLAQQGRKRFDLQAVHWSSVGDPRAADSAVMQWARENGCVVFTHDLDFSALIAQTRADGPSVLQVRTQDVLPAAIGLIVIDVIGTYAEELKQGAIITIDELMARVRILPIGSEAK
jgi:predicted nuclease of predicted toxin-antitoxin system